MFGDKAAPRAGGRPETRVEQQDKIQQEEEFDEVTEDDYSFPFDPELGPPSDCRVPSLDFRFTHILGMAVVAGAILAAAISVNGGLNAGKGSESRSAASLKAGESRPDGVKMYEFPALATEAQAAKVGPAIRYLNAATAACEKTSNSLAQLDTILTQFSTLPDYQKNAEWSNGIVKPLIAADGAVVELLKLPDPPVEFSAPNLNLHTAGRELHSSLDSFARAIATGNTTYVRAAVEHHRNCQQIVNQSMDEFTEYRRKVGL